MKLIVGLGNPGAEYAGTRHNVGFEVIERLANRHGIAVVRRDFRSVFGDGRIADEKVILMRPMTYMNLSGEAVGALCRFYKIAPGDVWVVLDDVALPPGQLRLRYKGSAGGHNGLESVLRHLQTPAVPRIRIGVGAPQPGELIGHVLSRFRREELPVMAAAYERAADAVECALREGFETAMNRFNVSERSSSRPAPSFQTSSEETKRNRA
jgi:PTH1 family peptidyl-tRNA hydrolase